MFIHQKTFFQHSFLLICQLIYHVIQTFRIFFFVTVSTFDEIDRALLESAADDQCDMLLKIVCVKN